MRGSESGLFEVTHDYIAAAGRELASVLLDAEDRDSIVYFAELMEKGVNRTVVERMTKVVHRPLLPRIDIPFAIVGALMYARWILEFGAWSFLEAKTTGITTTPEWVAWLPGDGRYLPGFIASMTCLFYTWQLFRNYFGRMERSVRGVGLTAGLTFLMMLSGTIWPAGWLLFASVAGFAIASRLRASHSGLGAKWLVKHGNILTRLSLGFFVYMSLTCSLGLVLVVLRYGGSDRALPGGWGYGVELALSLMVAIFIIMSWRNHATSRRGAVLIGVADRMRATE